MRSVLVVNDSKTERQRLVEDLTDGGFAISGESPDGIDAVSKYKRMRPDVVIMDLIMPGKGGLEAAFDIMSANNRANIILYSSVRNETIISKALDFGVKYFLPRDYKKEQLIKMVSEIGIR